MRQPVVSPPESMQKYWKDEVIRNRPDQVSCISKEARARYAALTYVHYSRYCDILSSGEG